MARTRIIEWIPMYPDDSVVWINVVKLDADLPPKNSARENWSSLVM
jgi:hypothetical protein